VNKDWTGNSRSAHATLGARNYAQNEREENDYYATEPKALELLLELETFAPNVWECACGEGHLSEVLKNRGYKVISSDLIERGYGYGGVDFLKCDKKFVGDIITNPPYKYAKEFVEHALEIVTNGHKVVMLLKVQFLEGKARRKMFEKYPPKKIYVSSGRLVCALNGDFEKSAKSNAVSYAWFIWEKGFTGDTIVKWFN
jgi:hypothetical protein